MIEAGYVSKQKHPTADLFIYNYTHRCQFDGAWTEETTQCRGLIADSKGNVVARPFRKFFNLSELTTIPEIDFDVYEKMDGSLGILYWHGDIPVLATRGSFVSEQAVRGSQILRNIMRGWEMSIIDKAYTYLFEIIYPENRIVVDYHGAERLVLLAKIHTETGIEGEINEEERRAFEVAKHYPGIQLVEQLKDYESENKEGFVIRWKNGVRAKVKFEEYVRLHRLVTGVNARRIWEILQTGGDTKELIDRVPDEFYKFVKETIARLMDQQSKITLEAFNEAERVKGWERKKAAAHIMKKHKDISSVIFCLLDNKPARANELVWKMIKPKHETPFKQEV